MNFTPWSAEAGLSVVVPVKDEAENILPVVEEIQQALAGRLAFELIIVDDGSVDGTAARLAQACARYPNVRALRHRRCYGQSTALASGIRAAGHRWVATLDGDGQNDPADIPRLLAALGERRGQAAAMVAGWRVDRHDSRVRRLSSRVANGVRGRLLGDGAPDTGCGLKIFSRDVFLRVPYFDHMHRFLPALFRREGVEVISVPVNHRPRLRGRSKYGIRNRLWVGIVDLFGVMWLEHRMTRPEIEG